MADVISPLPGVFYHRPGPGKEPFVTVGSVVEIEDTVGIIEIMKQFTEIRSDAAGTVVEIRVPDGGTVNPGDVLLVVQEA